MRNPGDFSLADLAITAALTAQALTPIQNLEGMLAATIEARFSYGSGGTSCSVVVQTTLDAGITWIDVARFDFTTASASKIANLSGLLSKAVAAVAALSSEGVNDGVFGSSLRAVITSVGSYSNTTLSVKVNVR